MGIRVEATDYLVVGVERREVVDSEVGHEDGQEGDYEVEEEGFWMAFQSCGRMKRDCI